MHRLLRMIYDRKYLRFGTSGVRARWGADFTQRRAAQVVQAVCDYLNDIDVPDFVDMKPGRETDSHRLRHPPERRPCRRMDRRSLPGQRFRGGFCNRDTPTPALVYYLTITSRRMKWRITDLHASHNPPEWQGIKFNPGWVIRLLPT